MKDEKDAKMLKIKNCNSYFKEKKYIYEISNKYLFVSSIETFGGESYRLGGRKGIQKWEN